MRLSERIEAAALFGSQVRGDTDELSDKDILLIGQDVHRQACQDELQSFGYSASFYSWNQFEELVREKSLFVQHLKQESKLLRDRNDRLFSLLRSYTPAADYSQRLAANRSLLLLTAGVPESEGGVAWALDVLAVGVRNLAVLENAQSGTFIFGHSDLLQQLARRHSLKKEETELLLRLRKDKVTYRCMSKNWSARDTTANYARLLATQALTFRIAGVSRNREYIDAEAFVRRRLVAADGDHWYVRLRSYEGAFRSIAGVWPTETTFKTAEIEALISHPSPYGPRRLDAIQRVRELIIQWGGSRAKGS